MSNTATAVTEAIVTIWSHDLAISTSIPYIAAILATATAASFVVAEFRRRNSAAISVESVYTQNFSKGLGIAIAIVLSLAAASVLVFEPAAANVMAGWVSFAALVGACSVLPATPSEMRELKSKGIYGLYWLPVLFAGSLFVVTFFAGG